MHQGIIDTHAHLYDEKIIANLDEIITSSKDINVSHIMMPNVDVDTIEAMHMIEEKYQNTHAMMGLHPCSVDTQWRDQMKVMEKWLDKRPYIGIGETGIDLYWDKTHFEDQQKAFQRQIDISKAMNLPIIIHSRNAIDVCIKMIAQSQDGKLTGIFHCFSEDLIHAQKIKDLGFYIGIGGVVTYKNAKLPEVLLENGLLNVVLETDSPYLPPMPHRGKANQPAYLQFIIEKIASSLNLSDEEVINTTTKNAMQVYQMN